MSGSPESIIRTGIDRLLEYLQNEQRVPSEEAADSLNVEEQTVLKWAEALENSGLVEINYSTTEGKVIRLLDTGAGAEDVEAAKKAAATDLTAQKLLERERAKLERYEDVLERFRDRLEKDEDLAEDLEDQVKEDHPDEFAAYLADLEQMETEIEDVLEHIKGLRRDMQFISELDIDDTEEKRSLLGKLRAKLPFSHSGKDEDKASSAEPATTSTTAPQTPPEDLDIDLPGTVEELREMPWNDLQRLASAYDLTSSEYNKETLLEALEYELFADIDETAGVPSEPSSTPSTTKTGEDEPDDGLAPGYGTEPDNEPQRLPAKMAPEGSKDRSTPKNSGKHPHAWQLRSRRKNDEEQDASKDYETVKFRNLIDEDAEKAPNTVEQAINEARDRVSDADQTRYDALVNAKLVELRQAVREDDVDLPAVLAAEKRNRNRKWVRDWLRDRIASQDET